MFLLGQPGAGKTETNEQITAQLANHGSAVTIDSDLYKPYHPQYQQLLRQDDTTAAVLVRPDGRRWMAKTEQYTRDNRFNVICEATVNDPAAFVSAIDTYRNSGYRIEAAVLAVPEALSRLGILDRYWQQKQAKGVGRLTALDAHQSAYQGVAAACRLIDHEHVVDAVCVIRRGNQLLYTNNLTADKPWSQPPQARQVLETERARPWAPQESAMFLSRIQVLQEQMGPQWSSQLDAIIDLARPLLLSATNRQGSSADLAGMAFPAPMITQEASSTPLTASNKHIPLPPQRISEHEL